MDNVGDFEKGQMIVEVRQLSPSTSGTVNFVACQLFALLTACWFRLYLHPSKTSPFIRHVVATLLGFYLALFCFGWYALHFLVQSGLTYGIMIFTGVEHMHRYCFVVALGYLTLCQITRVYVFDYGMYSADFTGKVRQVWMFVFTGLTKKEEHLKPTQRYLAVRKMPSLLEYLSYNCNFLGILAGPTCSYNDYTTFIEGTGYQHRHVESNGKENGKFKQSDPSPKQAVLVKLSTCALCLLIYLFFYRICPVERVIEDPYITSQPFYLRILYLYLSMLSLRPKYYFVWTLADAINNAAGLGFNGYNKDGTPRWDLISNLRILEIESATSFKTFLDNWNIQTALWLKRVCYERCPYHPTAATFLLSAIWHGVYPGYYFTFITGIAMTLAARAVRHNVRQHFLGSSTLKLIYDVITWASTQIAICYTVVPFVVLSVGASLKFYCAEHHLKSCREKNRSSQRRPATSPAQTATATTKRKLPEGTGCTRPSTSYNTELWRNWHRDPRAREAFFPLFLSPNLNKDDTKT
ncbi:Membrane-bound O-acyltransferase domain-containing protein 2 [Bagarius yarrelli]|uniref:Membrane-bound O-acyltransferase domain-containing protein 2 n=1 Tax=Bagarius yarrelli TaxID=175774 RepID=A0A556U7M5_BAGYA|nr:Membrane-bound O-acyltransferase domain-containing protein 2 [Bagarius yarrelli]